MTVKAKVQDKKKTIFRINQESDQFSLDEAVHWYVHWYVLNRIGDLGSRSNRIYLPGTDIIASIDSNGKTVPGNRSHLTSMVRPRRQGQTPSFVSSRLSLSPCCPMPALPLARVLRPACSVTHPTQVKHVGSSILPALFCSRLQPQE